MNPEEILQTLTRQLWEIASKYRKLLRQQKVPPTRQSEEDRQKVSPLYKELRSSIDLHLDGEVYRLLTEAQSIRDEQALFHTSSPKRRLAQMGLEVALRRQPIVSVPQQAFLNLRPLLSSLPTLTEAKRARARLPTPRRELPPLPQEKIEELKLSVLSKVRNRRFTPEELGATLSLDEATVLSQMARKGEVVLYVEQNSIRLLTRPRRKRALRSVSIVVGSNE